VDFNSWTYEDFLQTLEAIRTFGSLEDLVERIPGMEALLRDAEMDLAGQLEPIERILRAMTPEERARPELLEGEEGPERRMAIAERAGTSLGAVEGLILQFQRLRDMLQSSSLEDVTRELMDEATPQREAWQESSEAWKQPSGADDEEWEDEDELLEELEGVLLVEAQQEQTDLTGARLDELLRKISASGLDSLSPSERDELERASSLLRERS